MDPLEPSRDTISEATAKESNAHRERFHQTPHEIQAASMCSSVATRAQRHSKSHSHVQGTSQGPNHPSELSNRVTNESQKASSPRAEDIQEAVQLAPATGPIQNHFEAPNFEPKELRRSSTTPANETLRYAQRNAPPQYSTDQRIDIGRYTAIELQNKELRNQIKRNQQSEAVLKDNLAQSEAHRANLQQRVEEASNTIFRLRPQRQEYTESEIERDYERLIKLVKNWIANNCESFLDDDRLELNIIGRYEQGARLRRFEAILKRFQSRSDRWIEAKEYILQAVVMRYLFDHILNQPFSILLREEERDFLNTIQDGMENAGLQKDLITIRTWRSDTATAINNHKSFRNRYPSTQRDLTIDLYDFLHGTVLNQESESTILSLTKEVINPAIELAQKTQSASSIWMLKYSDYSNCEPGEFASNLHDFLANIDSFQCVNMSKRGKLLKPATDLATEEQQKSLIYVLDIFPGLFCQRVIAGDSQPVSMINRPLILVAFANDTTREQTWQAPSVPADVEAVKEGQRSAPPKLGSTGNKGGIIKAIGEYVGLAKQTHQR